MKTDWKFGLTLEYAHRFTHTQTQEISLTLGYGHKATQVHRNRLGNLSNTWIRVKIHTSTRKQAGKSV